MRRCQILRASARGERAPKIARQLGCDDQTVRNLIHGFNATGLSVLQEAPRVPISCTPASRRTGWCASKTRLASQSTRLWQRARCIDPGVGSSGQFRAGHHRYPHLRRERAPRAQALENQLEAAKHWITSPDPQYQQKNARDRLLAWARKPPSWAIGFGDEVWWSRFALPQMHAKPRQDQPLRLVEQHFCKDDPDPKALACYGFSGSREIPRNPTARRRGYGL
jgi:hypothetical protein